MGGLPRSTDPPLHRSSVGRRRLVVQSTGAILDRRSRGSASRGIYLRNSRTLLSKGDLLTRPETPRLATWTACSSEDTAAGYDCFDGGTAVVSFPGPPSQIVRRRRRGEVLPAVCARCCRQSHRTSRIEHVNSILLYKYPCWCHHGLLAYPERILANDRRRYGVWSVWSGESRSTCRGTSSNRSRKHALGLARCWYRFLIS